MGDSTITSGFPPAAAARLRTGGAGVPASAVCSLAGAVFVVLVGTVLLSVVLWRSRRVGPGVGGR